MGDEGEGHEGCQQQQGLDQGCLDQGHRGSERVEDQGGLSDLRQPCCHCYEGGEEDWCLHRTRPLPHQDQDKASDKSSTRVMFGVETKVKAKPARTVVKAFPVSTLKKQI